MKTFWMNQSTATAEEKKLSRTAQIVATELQRESIFALERHVFGSKDGYFKWRESGKPFPAEYRAAKNFILNYPWGTKEFYDSFILSIPTADKVVIYDQISNASIDDELIAISY